MVNQAVVTARNTPKLPGYVDVYWDITKEEALHELDVGRTSIKAINTDNLAYELEALQDMGYKLVLGQYRQQPYPSILFDAIGKLRES
tara:strand:+ start:2916 stop:3179 length:264 start_codon:yes stop_codon:yes gene_type:complete